ncbi:secreted RxLR effector protein 161-like [Stegodyphus dumicola]|uniref:secreted RxLR effector protein 161-like n=1 Tax=Stegodyphus dumicola TaxID=202533 RepID=UPI0015AF8BA8|nr:secreted RxLR effector protein 161-like [Stegodyphus dumicola]
MSDCRPVHTPILKDKVVYTEEVNETDIPYREAVGALMYLMMGTRPDLAYSISVLSRKLENPSKEDWIKVKRVFRYIANSKQKCIIYKSGYKPGILECFSDADFVGCIQTGRSTSEVICLYAGGTISWLSQCQGHGCNINYRS